MFLPHVLHFVALTVQMMVLWNQLSWEKDAQVMVRWLGRMSARLVHGRSSPNPTDTSGPANETRVPAWMDLPARDTIGSVAHTTHMRTMNVTTIRVMNVTTMRTMNATNMRTMNATNMRTMNATNRTKDEGTEAEWDGRINVTISADWETIVLFCGTIGVMAVVALYQLVRRGSWERDASHRASDHQGMPTLKEYSLSEVMQALKEVTDKIANIEERMALLTKERCLSLTPVEHAVEGVGNVAENGTDAAENGTDAAENGTDAAETGTDAAERCLRMTPVEHAVKRPINHMAENGTDAAERCLRMTPVEHAVKRPIGHEKASDPAKESNVITKVTHPSDSNVVRKMDAAGAQGTSWPHTFDALSSPRRIATSSPRLAHTNPVLDHITHRTYDYLAKTRKDSINLSRATAMASRVYDHVIRANRAETTMDDDQLLHVMHNVDGLETTHDEALQGYVEALLIHRLEKEVTANNESMASPIMTTDRGVNETHGMVAHTEAPKEKDRSIDVEPSIDVLVDIVQEISNNIGSGLIHSLALLVVLEKRFNLPHQKGYSLLLEAKEAERLVVYDHPSQMRMNGLKSLLLRVAAPTQNRNDARGTVKRKTEEAA